MDDAEELLIRPVRAGLGQASVLGQAAGRPTPRAFEGLLLVGARVEQGGQLVEGEDDVGAQFVLDAHRDLGSEAVPRPVQVGTEPHAVVVDVDEALLGGASGAPGTGELGGEDLFET